MKRVYYETGIEEPEILGSGSNYYSVFTTCDEREAINESQVNFRNYLSKIVWENGKRSTYNYNFDTKKFE